ncbi:MAG TPA: response regulator transcription factor [Rectinemataceae bacterium]|nr:response regulator transcription factor [Rectinemataceae bacterium]
MRGKILIVEDTVELADLYALYLAKEGLECRIAHDAESGLLLMKEGDWNLVILDLNLPGMDGFEFLEHVRKTSQVPVMILTAREADEDVIHGLGVGADDFVTKPCPPRVLAARVRAYIRRAQVPASGREGAVWHFGPFELDAEALFLTKGGSPISLSPREFGILQTLLEAKGKSFTPEELYDKVWGQNFGDVSAVGVYIQRLRRKIEDDPASPRYIQTQYGLGYRFNPETIS